jgi:Na+/H+-dicarboxylate symporter
MPAMIASLTDGLGLSRSRVELLVPLGISLLRIGPVLYYVVATLFIAQLYGVALGPGQLALAAVAGVLAGFASSGMSGLVTISLTGLVCAYLGLPFEAALALFAAIDPLCDVLRTVVLVAGNIAFAAVASGAPAAGDA